MCKPISGRDNIAADVVATVFKLNIDTPYILKNTKLETQAAGISE